ncbi:molybdopterin-synthase adenylyltransferase MoeB [Sphingomonas gilva]|uniref:Molybdopterin-synthase adenylyltransferase n=1 Tax=Sphingomonas gilva TaxID=2305907 RepID=A0A396RJG3_9SPHN|nr:molybdopterin-synthase adenylyltransferase MoeB [Sphingomonas gilva]RHW16284.1 molybdopterin-synthase adenylyltransferase MoeB [Sphingomonas gilva]
MIAEPSDAELERYARHIVLPEIGGLGQVKLRAATVAIVGAGGIGSPAIQYLAAAGVGRLRIADDDEVALSNLQRQTLFGTQDVGRGKCEVAAEAVHHLNPHVATELWPERIEAHNAGDFVQGANVVVDGSDSFATRLLVADAALAAKVPLVSAAVGRFEGQLATYRGWEPDAPCYRCLVGADPGLAEVSCAEQGVLGALTGVMGSLAAMEAVRAITAFGEDAAGKLLLFDALSLRARTLTLAKDPACAACGR